MPISRQIKLENLFPHINCCICLQYLIDPVRIVECFHVFCRYCLLKHFKKTSNCPVEGCGSVISAKGTNISEDLILRRIIYKCVPDLFSSEKKLRDHLQFDKNKHSCEGRISNSIDSLLQFSNSKDISTLHQSDFFYSSHDFIQLCIYFTRNEKNTSLLHRYFNCSASLPIRILRKFIRRKLLLSHKYKIELLHQGIILPRDIILMDAVYMIIGTKKNILDILVNIYQNCQTSRRRKSVTTFSQNFRRKRRCSTGSENSDMKSDTFLESKFLSQSINFESKDNLDCRLKFLTKNPDENVEHIQSDKYLLADENPMLDRVIGHNHVQSNDYVVSEVSNMLSDKFEDLQQRLAEMDGSHSEQIANNLAEHPSVTISSCDESLNDDTTIKTGVELSNMIDEFCVCKADEISINCNVPIFSIAQQNSVFLPDSQIITTSANKHLIFSRPVVSNNRPVFPVIPRPKQTNVTIDLNDTSHLRHVPITLSLSSKTKLNKQFTTRSGVLTSECADMCRIRNSLNAIGTTLTLACNFNT